MPATIDIPELGTLELPEGTTDEQASVIGRDVYTRQVHLPRLKSEITANLQEAQNKTIEAGAYKVGEYAARSVDILGSVVWLGDVVAGFATDLFQGRVLPTPSRGIIPNLSSTGAALAQEPDTSVNAKLPPFHEGLVEAGRAAPVIGAGMAVAATGIPAYLAFGGVMGGTTLRSSGSWTEAGKSATVGAVIPTVGAASKALAGRALAGAVNRGIVSAENVTAQKLIEASAEFAGITAFLEALNIPSYMEMGPGERSDAFAKSLASQLAFLPMSLMGLRGGRPSVTQEMLAKDKPIPTYTPLPRDEVPLAPLLLTEGAPAPRGPIITPPPPIKLSGISQAEVALRESAILLRQTVPEPVKREAQREEIPILGQRPVTIEQELILPEKFMQAEAARDALIAEQAKVTVDFSDAAGSLDFTGMEAAKQQLLGIYGNLHENVELRKSLSEQLEGDYPPKAEQLGTFQSRAVVPELSDATKNLDPSKLGGVDQPESTRLRAGRAVQPGEQVYPDPPVGVVPPESLRSEFVPEADVPEYPPKRPPATAPEGEQRTGIISGTDLEKWADRVNAEDPRSKTRMSLDPIEEVRRVAAAAVKGAALLERGIRDFAAWSAEMIKQHGPWIEKSLPDLFKKSNKYLEVKQAQQEQEKFQNENKLIAFKDQMDAGIEQAVQGAKERFKQTGLKVGDILYTPSGTQFKITEAAVTYPRKLVNGKREYDYSNPLVFVEQISSYKGNDSQIGAKSTAYLNKLSIDNPNTEGTSTTQLSPPAESKSDQTTSPKSPRKAPPTANPPSELVTEFTDPTKAEKKKSSRMPYGDRMNTAMDAVSAPENKGKYIPAIQTADGEIITANDHTQAWEKMRKEGKKPANSKVMGYVDHDGKFLTLKDIAALESKEPVETAKAGEGETETVTEPATTPVTKEGGGPGETQTQTQGQEVLGKKPLRPLGEIYSEPFAERIRRLGGVVADKVAKDTQGIIDNAKRLYGELSADWLDKAKIASGKAFRGGTTWMNGIDNIKNSAGVVNAKASVSRLFTALETFNKTGNWDHVPTAARPLAKMLYDANLAMGRLANQGNPIGAVDSVKRLVTPWGTDVLKRGGGRAWEALVNGHAEANNKTVAFTENFFRRWKAELDKPTPDSTALDKISKEYVASFPNAVTHLKPILGWHEFLQSSPFHYLEQSGQRIANTVAFQQVYPPGSGKLNQTRTAIQAEVKTDAGMKEFDDMTRALRGYPTDVWWTIAPDTITGAASRAIGMALRPIKSLLLTQSLATNTGETLSGGAAIFFGYGRAFKAMYVSKQLRQQMIRTGQINKAIRDFSFSPAQPLQSLSKIGANLISRTFLNDFANEVQEFASARAAKIVADEIRTGTLPASDVPLIENTLRMMGFTKEQSKAAVAGNAPDVINQFETKAAEALSSGNQILAEKSRLGSSRTFNLLFWFHNYPMLKFRQGRSILNNIIEDASSRDWKGARSNAKLMGRFLGGTALSGAITAGVLALVKEGLYGVGIRKQEAQDDLGRFVMDSFLMGMGGPLMTWSKIFEETGSVGQFTKDLPERVFDSVTPYSMAKNLGNAVTGSKEYEGLDSFEKIGKFLETKTPGLRPFKAGLAAVSLIQDNPKLDASIGAYYRWSHRNIGSNKTEIRKLNDDRKEVRHFAERVAKNIQDGKPFTDDLIKEIVAASKTKTDNPYDSAADSIRGKQILGMSVSDDGKIHGKLSAEELGALRKHIGDDPVNRIMAYDTMLDQVADYVAAMKVKE